MSDPISVALLRCRVTPKAKKSEILGWAEAPQPGDFDAGRVLRVKLKAPPIEGKANRELVAFLAKQLGLSKSTVTIRSGEKSRLKLVEIVAMTSDDVAAAIEKILSTR